MRFDPHPYQSHCIHEIEEKPAVALFLDMGLGKTVITLTAVRNLKCSFFRIRKCLIIAPKKVAEATWQAEAEKWDHLKGLRISTVLGTESQRNAALAACADVYIINRENVVWLVQKFRGKWPFDMVVLDESSSFKNHQAKRFKALRAVRPAISRIVELTGTPSPHGLMDLWAQIYLLDGGQRLGKYITHYRDAFFLPDKRNQMIVYSYRPRTGADEQIRRLISDICVSMKSEDYLQLPEIVYEDIPVVLDPAAEKAYRELERTMVLDVDETEITAMSAVALSCKLLQLCNGAVYDEAGEPVHVHDCKLDALQELTEQLGDEHAVICYCFRHDRERILRALSGSGKRIRAYSGPLDLMDWNAGRIDYLLIHPASCGYGLNLQQGGRHMIWFGLTWNLEEYQQANARLYRQGQTKPVIVHHLLVKGHRDEDVLRSLSGKDRVQEALLDSLKVIIRKAKEEVKT